MKKLIYYIILILFSFLLISTFKVVDLIYDEYFDMVYTQPSINKQSTELNKKLSSMMDSTFTDNSKRIASANFEYFNLENFYNNEIILSIMIGTQKSISDKKTKEIIDRVLTLIKRNYSEKIVYGFSFKKIEIYLFNTRTTLKYNINWNKNLIILESQSKH